MTDFVITSSVLQHWGACGDGIRKFLSEFKGDSATIEQALDACERRENRDYAQWLLNTLVKNQIPLPAALASVAGWLDLDGYQHPLPAALAENNDKARGHNIKLAKRAAAIA